MVVFPNAKINLGLYVVEKRPDGYHNLETVFFPTPWSDALEIVFGGQQDSLKTYGLKIEGNPQQNLVLKAINLLRTEGFKIPPCQVYLNKSIPTGAGLGGGSADAAFALKLLNAKAELNLSEDLLIDFAARLGSDCPFFIKNKPVYATGRGEIMEEIELNFSGYYLMIAHPGVMVSTAEAFAGLRPEPSNVDLRTAIQQPVETWQSVIINHFEKTVCAKYPAIQGLIDSMRQSGAVYVQMSGSGSAVFGLFRTEPSDLNAQLIQKGCKVFGSLIK